MEKKTLENLEGILERCLGEIGNKVTRKSCEYLGPFFLRKDFKLLLLILLFCN